MERVRETMTGLPALEHLAGRVAEGWRLVAVEWEREASAAPPPAGAPVVEPIPYGLRVSDDCSGLAEDANERQIILTALDMIVDDRPLSQVAAELNRRGHRTRDGQEWTPTALFLLLPRMIEVGPRLFSSGDWMTRKQRLERLV
ncbi:MAG: hypothetical protein JST11_26215 [Acidobacteria bacterium]|nr:hypothetical protein [Acidobacteriota bacterium]